MDKVERTAMDERAVEVLREVLSRTECRENGLRANMDEIASMAHQMIKIVQRGALRPDPNTGWLEPAPPLAKPAPMSTSGEMVERLIKLAEYNGAGANSVIRDALREAASRLESLEALFAEQAGELERVEKALEGAAEDIEHWGSYAGAYIQDKHDLKGDIEAVRSVLSDIRKARGKE